MAAVTWSGPPMPPAPPMDQRMVLHGVSWKEYVILREALETPGLRMTFCEGVLELTSPSRNHEMWKKTIARLVELYAFLSNVPLFAYGSTTFRNEAKQRGAEPDECWRIGSQMKEGELPDIVLEVVHESPIMDKLHVYDGLGVPEVWLWKDGAFAVYRRQPEGGYRAAPRSTFVAGLDLGLVAKYVTREDQDVALREFAEVVRAGS